jgi:hypothetical protein
MSAKSWNLDALRLRSFIGKTLSLIVLPVLMLSSIAYAQEFEALYGPHGIDPLAVRQGVLGSCYFHSSIAALAKTKPEILRRAVKGNIQNGFQIKFISGPAEEVYAEDVDYGIKHTYDRSEGPWVAVLMRGYAQHQLRRGIAEGIEDAPLIFMPIKPIALEALDQSGPLLLAYDRAIREVVTQDGDLSSGGLQAALAHQFSMLGIPKAEAEMFTSLMGSSGFFNIIANVVRQNGEVFGVYSSLGQGGIPAYVLGAFQGNGSAGDSDKSELIPLLAKVHAGTLAMVAGTKGSGPPPSAEMLAASSAPGWYYPGHAYTVMDYDAAERVVTMRNPWGTKPDPNGVFRIPLSVFRVAYPHYFY